MHALAPTLAGRPSTAPRAGSGAAGGRGLAGRPAFAPPRATTGSGGGLETSVSLGPPTPGSGAAGRASPAPGTSSKAAVLSLDDVDITSEAGIDWAPLRTALAAGDFRAADDEHRARLIELAGPGAVARGWVYFSEVKAMPASDLRVMDNLWKAASAGKFGFSPQREVWLQNRKRWDRFFKQIDWVVGEDNNYRKWPGEFKYEAAAVKGHLPLTNALRGTQLFEAILEHPAFAEAGGGGGAEGGGGKASGGPSWL